LVGANHGLAARNHKARDAHEIREAGVGRFGDDDQGLARRVLDFGLRPVLPPVISRRQSDKEDRTQSTLEVFGKRHRRINSLDCNARRAAVRLSGMERTETLLGQGKRALRKCGTLFR
jgi:hypothetical protein